MTCSSFLPPFRTPVGAAAAGLTLTAASTVVLLEPLLCASDEAQAVNRCHRLGQTAPVVNIIQLYVTHSVEERLLAYRGVEEARGAARGAAAAAAAAAASAATAAAAADAADEEADADAAAAAAAARKRKGKARVGSSPAQPPPLPPVVDSAAAAPGEDGSVAGSGDSVRDARKLRYVFGIGGAGGGAA